MEDQNLKLYFREIVYHNPSTKKKSVCGVFSYEALTAEEMQLGNLYLVGKISDIPVKKHKSFDFLLNLLASAIKRDFHANTKKNVIEAMESALQGANIYLTDFTKRGHREWIGNLDFTCLAFSQNNIHIGQTGNMLVYLLRQNTITNIAKKFSILQKNEPIKTFSNIASGTLEEGDKLIISTNDILNLVSQQKIKEMNMNSGSEEFYDFLKESLENQTRNNKNKKDSEREPISSMACLILDAETKPPQKEKRAPKKEKTEIVGIDLQKLTNSYLIKTNNLLKTDLAKPGSSRLINFLSKYSIVNYLLALFVVFSLLLSPYVFQKIGYETKINKIENLAERIKTLTGKSEIALAYQDQATAQSLLQQADALTSDIDSVLAELPPAVKEKAFNGFQKIKEDLNLQQNSINNVVIITNLEEITDLAKSTYTFNPQGMLLLENTIYLYEITSGFINKINLDNPASPTLVFVSSKDTFKLGAVRENSLFLLSNPEKIYVYGKNDNYNTYLIKPNLENTLNIKDMTNYNNNIYFLDTAKQTILKYSPEETLLNGSNWLKKNSDPELGDAQSFAVDGSVFVSKANGLILEYVQGQKSREIKPQISPAINNGTKLFTNDRMKNLYALDPTNKRIISINKKDNFTVQYVSENFDSLKSFWVSDNEKTIFLLNGSKIYKIEI
ncbi:MAG: hypothetical protein Q8N59_02085 [bacterium]|nr:hypothetical protein [bacterium]